MQLGGSRPKGQREKEPWLGGPLTAPDTLPPRLSRAGGLAPRLCEQRVAIQTPTAPRKGYLQSGPFKCVQLDTEKPRPRAMTGHPLVNVRPGGGMDKGRMLLLVIWWWGWSVQPGKDLALAVPASSAPVGKI